MTGSRPITPGRATRSLRRYRRVDVRFDDLEFAELERRAHGAGSRQLARYLRTIALSRAVPSTIIPELNREAWLALAETAQTLGVIGDRITTDHTLDAQDAERLVTLLTEVQKDIRRLRLELVGVLLESEAS